MSKNYKERERERNRCEKIVNRLKRVIGIPIEIERVSEIER